MGGQMEVFRRHPRLFAVGILVLFWAGIYLPGLGLPEIDMDEQKRILPAVSMLETGNWIVPELAGEKYFNKPPLINWLIAASFKALGGRSEFAARLPSVLSVLAFVLLLALLPSKLISFQGRFMAALIYMTALAVIAKGRMSEIDAIYTSLTGAALFMWFELWNREDARPWLVWTLPFAVLGIALLLKGPMILVFFYCLVICVHVRMGRARELLCPFHFVGIIIMAAIFAAWAYPCSLHNTGCAEEGGKMASTWMHELLLRFHENVRPGKWLGNVAGAVFSFLPWLLLVPFMWSRSWLKCLDDKDLKIFKAARLGVIIAFILVCLMPSTRARYSMPSFAMASVLLGWLLSVKISDEAVEKYWKILLSALFPAMAAVSVMGIIAVAAGGFGIEKIKPFMELFRGSTLSAAVIAALAANFAAYQYFKVRKITDGFINLTALTALSIFIGMLMNVSFVLPCAKIYEHFRPVGAAVDAAVPEGAVLYAYKVGSEHFLFYVGCPVRHLKKIGSLPDDAGYLLIEEGAYSEIGPAPFIKDRMPELLKELKSDKRTFKLIRFGKCLRN